MYYIYILQSEKNDQYYVGSTGNLEDRLKRHNAGYSKSTRPHVPYKIIYVESFETLSDARRRETEIKKQKSRKYIRSLLK